MPRPCPAVLRCRDPQSLRASLTIFSAVDEGEILDFQSVTWIDVGALVLLHRKAQEAGPVRFFFPTRTVTRDYIEDQLRRSVGGDQYSYSLEQPNQFPVRYVADERSMKRELREWRRMLRDSEAVPEEEARNYSRRMSEVLTNSFTHGQTERPCILGGQTFRKAGHSALVAVDAGCTIPVSLGDSDRYPGPREDHEWIQFAFEKGVTAKTENTNKGFGLHYLKSIVQANGGSLMVVSGDGLAFLENGGELETEPLGENYDRFEGTMILLDLQRR